MPKLTLTMNGPSAFPDTASETPAKTFCVLGVDKVRKLGGKRIVQAVFIIEEAKMETRGRAGEGEVLLEDLKKNKNKTKTKNKNKKKKIRTNLAGVGIQSILISNGRKRAVNGHGVHHTVCALIEHNVVAIAQVAPDERCAINVVDKHVCSDDAAEFFQDKGISINGGWCQSEIFLRKYGVVCVCVCVCVCTYVCVCN